MFLRTKISRIFWAGGAACWLACSANGDQQLGKVLFDESTAPEASTINTEAAASCQTAPPIAAMPLTLDLQLIVDRSQSMFGNGQPPSNGMPMPNDKWDLLVQALTTSLVPDVFGTIGVGLSFFPTPPPDPCVANCNGDCFCLAQCGCTYCPMRGDMRACGRNTFSCDPAVYRRAEVQFDQLPANTSALLMALNQRDPGGPTVLRPALRGALDHAGEWGDEHPNERVVEIVIAGGPPFAAACDPNTVDACAQVARGSLTKTYVIAFSTDRPTLDPIAAAGGTKQAFAARTTAQLTDAFRQIISAESKCEYALPSTGATFDQGSVNVAISLPSGTKHLEQTQTCQTGVEGWYYDSIDHPSRIILCDATCSGLPADASVQTLVGCPTMTTATLPPP